MPTRTKKFTAEERAAMKERAKEAKSDATEADVLAKIREMPPADRAMAEKLHALVKRSAPTLTPRLWYGMPAYASAAGVVCFFQAASKFKTRYSTFGFSDKATLDDGDAWPTAYAITKLTAATESTLGALIARAAR